MPRLGAQRENLGARGAGPFEQFRVEGLGHLSSLIADETAKHDHICHICKRSFDGLQVAEVAEVDRLFENLLGFMADKL